MRRLLLLAVFFAIFSNVHAALDDGAFYSNIVRIAEESIGLTSVPKWNGVPFRSDCIGFVKYVFFKAGLDLDRVARMGGNNGVAVVYHGLLDRRFTYTNGEPVPGDLVFFDNTYDFNGNGAWDDPLTHIGIVTGKLSHRTWTWVHFASGEVKEYRLNLAWPDTHAFRRRNGELMVINSYLRRDRGEGLSAKEYVSSSFFRAFAHIRVRYRSDLPASAKAN